MKIVVLAGGTVSGAECVPLHWNHGDRGAAGAGPPGGPDRLIFRPGDGRGGRGIFLTRLCPRPTRKSAARLGSGGAGGERVSGWRGGRGGGKGPPLVRPGVLELCRMADMVFLALHGTCGEDGRVQAAFDLMGIPYTGAGYLGSAIAMDKDLTKRMVADVVSTPGWKTVTYTAADIDRLVETARLPLVVKPVASGSSIGVSIAYTAEELRRSLTEGLALGGARCWRSTSGAGRSRWASWRIKPCPPLRSSPSRAFTTMPTSTSPAPLWRSARRRLLRRRRRVCGPRPLRVYETLGLSVYSPRGLHPHGGRGALVPGDQHPARHDTHQPAAPGGRGGGH